MKAVKIKKKIKINRIDTIFFLNLIHLNFSPVKKKMFWDIC